MKNRRGCSNRRGKSRMQRGQDDERKKGRRVLQEQDGHKKNGKKE